MKKVIILGASRYYLKSIEATRRAGYYVIAVDRNAESEGFKSVDKSYVCDIIDKDGILKIAQEEKVTAVVPVNDYGVPTAAYVANKLNLNYISEKAALLATNKEEMRKKWIADGIPCPKVEVGNTPEQIREAIQRIGFPCILKPAHGYGGASRGVVVVNNSSEIGKGIEFATAFYNDHTTLIESFIEAEFEHSAEVLIYKGQVNVIAISDKIKTPLPFRVDKCVLYPTAISKERIDELKKVIGNAVISLGITSGAAHVELASTKTGYVLFELGARCGGGGTPEPIVSHCTGVDEFLEQVRILAGDPPINLTPTRNLGCNYHFITPEPGRIKEIEGIDNIRNLEGILDFEFFKKPGDEIVPVTVGTERSGFIICAAQTQAQAYNLGKKAESLLKIKYY